MVGDSELNTELSGLLELSALEAKSNMADCSITTGTFTRCSERHR